MELWQDTEEGGVIYHTYRVTCNVVTNSEMGASVNVGDL